MNRPQDRDTIAAIATPAGRGGVGVVRISGPEAFEMLGRICPNAGKLAPRVATLVSWQDENGELLDQGIALAFPAPNSYTGEDVIELQGHGSPVLLQALLARLFQLGCRPAGPGEFTRRAVENGKIDLSQAEAVAACIDAATLRAGKQAQKQLSGAFGQHIESLMQALTGLVAHLEACLDFPEEEIPELFLKQLEDQVHQQVIEPVERLLNTADLGERLFEGAVVAIIGAPNVGKSSLLNALAGRERAIVSDIPGTTRDVLEVDFEVHGIPVRLADTAGLRSSDDQIEQEGVRRAEQAAALADAVVFVADATRTETWRPNRDVDICLMNKTDLARADFPEGFIPVAVKQGRGIDKLCNTLAEKLGDVTIADEGLLVTRERHRNILQEAKAHLLDGLQTIRHEDQLELTAMEWRRSWSLLGSLLGLGDVEHILDRVFSEFCIGK